VASTIRGKRAADALLLLRFLKKRAASPLYKLLQSAMANAENSGAPNVENLHVASVRVDKGVTMKRSMPRARGRASRINKRTSHITLTLREAQ